ncbi:OmpA family protein [Rufibacter psychrotolerans]|uniref:OmpA family protein n=1 Tax=Rufibacter psychrotolerans TaxID=2812556 RepID=UPI001967E020|nr:OmpA family protein [Rufibacter sp. SYSU D00308]
MMRHKTLVLALSLAAVACGPFRSSVQKGNKNFEKEEYQLAIEHYQAALNKGRTGAEVNFKLAEAYRLSNRMPQAEQYYKAALDARKNEETMFRYGMALKANGKYEEAATQLQSYLAVASNKTFIRLAQREVENLRQVASIANTPTYRVVKPVPGTNSAASEFSPIVLNNELIFSSTREETKYKGNGEGFLNLYVVPMADTGNTTATQVRPFAAALNAPEVHDASPAFTNEGRTMVFARSNTGKKSGTANVDLYISQYKTGEWSEPRIASFNDPVAWDASPAFSPDGRTLYFSSDRRGGQGGRDIWKTTLDAGGRFSRPVNLGPEINTPGNESFPYVGPDSTLYIASDGHPGLGGLDIFRVSGDSVINMGAPINSIGDDFSILMTGEDQGLFASNRGGGQGGDDLYSFVKRQPKLVNFFVDGRVLERNEKGNTTPMPNARVTLQNAQGVKVEEATADAKGAFTFRLDSASVYSVIAERQGYFAARQSVITQGKTPPQSQLTQPVTDIRLTATLTLSKIVRNKAIVVENIFYDYDKANIRPDAAVELDKLVQTLVDNPTITIELSSHTDSRGVDIYNQDLSQRRAQSAVDYIISKGIDPKRITARGYGESRPVIRNAKTEAQHQQNRRTEFKVTRIDEPGQ